MKSIIDRGSFTTLVLAALTPLGYPVGDGEMPENDGVGEHAGWNGEPNMPGSIYVPYFVVSVQSAGLSSGSFRDPQDGWQLPYSLASFGLSRAHVEAMANKGRKALRELHHDSVVLDSETYKVQQVHFTTLGAVIRSDATSPATFGEVDAITFWLTQ